MATIARLQYEITAKADGAVDGFKRTEVSLARLKREAPSLYRETRTPLEQYEYRLKRVVDMYAKGAISADTYMRALKKLKAEQQSAEGGGHGKGGFWSVPRGLPGTGALRHFGHMAGAAAGAYVAIEAAEKLSQAYEESDKWAIKVAADTGRIPGGLEQGAVALKSFARGLMDLQIIKVPMQLGASLRYALDPIARREHVREEAENANQEKLANRQAAMMRSQLKVREQMKGDRVEATTNDSAVDRENKRYQARLRELKLDTSLGAVLQTRLRHEQEILHTQNLQTIAANERLEKQKKLNDDIAEYEKHLKAEIAAVGKDPAQVRIETLKEQGASKQDIEKLQALERTLEARKQEQKLIDEANHKLEEQKAAQERIREEILKIYHPDEGNYAQALRQTGDARLAKQYEEAKRFEKMREEARSLKKELETPQERSAARLKDLNEMLKANLITQKEFDRASATEHAQGTERKEVHGEEFSRGFMDLTAMAGNRMGDPSLEESKKTNRLLERVARSMDRLSHQGSGLQN